MRRGDVRLVDFEPSQGSEASKRRPAVVVSNNRANDAADRDGRGVVTVAPLTSNVAKVYAFQVLVPVDSGAGLKVDSKVQAEQVRSLAFHRVGPILGRLPRQLMAEVDRALRLHLDL